MEQIDLGDALVRALLAKRIAVTETLFFEDRCHSHPLPFHC
jgi:hypothetical protein